MIKRIVLRVLLLVAIIIVPLTIYLAPEVAAGVYRGIVLLAPLWLPLALLALAVPSWLIFVRSQYVSAIPYSIIELKPGAETPRTARAMELVFYALYYRNTISLVSAFFLGQVRLPWSFEIYAHAGSIRFFVYLPTAHRAAVEARIRAEYPDIDIDEARDYAREFAFDPFSMRLDVREYTLSKADPYPLRTYLSSENAKRPRDTFIDFLEDLVSLGEEEHMFISWIVMPHQRERRKFWERPMDFLHQDAEAEIVKIIGPGGNFHELSENKQRLISAIESALKKPSFDCGVRALYIAKRREFDEGRSSALDTLFDSFGDDELNSLVAYDPRGQVGWPLSEVFVAAPVLSMNYLINLYRRRAFFNPPYYGRSFVLNTEELATVYHLPHVTRASPLSKGTSAHLEPPENLPV
mgnify:CR=1 FL=1